MNKRPTIIDVARHAGVSKSTVSLVLQNSTLVKSETRAAVKESIKSLGYVYNRAAAKLRGSDVGLIGLVINDLRNPFFTEFATTAQMTFSRHGYATVIANTDENPDIQDQVISSMLEHDVSALLISPCYGGDGHIFSDIERSNTPTIQVLRRVDSRTDLFPFYSMDYETGGRLAAEHLIEQGARNIAFVGGIEDGDITQERMSGYLQVLKEHDLVPTMRYGRATRKMGRDAAIDIATSGQIIDAIICFNDLVSLGMLSGFAQTNMVVGRDVLLIGFDDIEECQQVYPELSSVRCDIEKFGKNVAKLVVDWLETGTRPSHLQRQPVELIARQSSLGLLCK